MAKITDHISIDNIGFLLNYCSKYPEIYNKIANHLYQRFGIQGAEIVLLITYFVTYYVAEERESNGKEDL